MVRTPGFHPGNRSSILRGATKSALQKWRVFLYSGIFRLQSKGLLAQTLHCCPIVRGELLIVGFVEAVHDIGWVVGMIQSKGMA